MPCCSVRISLYQLNPRQNCLASGNAVGRGKSVLSREESSVSERSNTKNASELPAPRNDEELTYMKSSNFSIEYSSTEIVANDRRDILATRSAAER